MSEDDGTIQSRSYFMQSVWGYVVAIMAVVLLGSEFARAPLDPADPWPKFGRDLGNTCHSPYRGPHSTPVLRWFAEAGYGGYDEQPRSAPDVRGGAAVARVNGVRYVFVAGNFDTGVPHCRRPVLRVFRFHPCETGNDAPCAPAPPIAEFVVAEPNCASQPNEIVVSTPLVLHPVYSGSSGEFVVVDRGRRLKLL